MIKVGAEGGQGLLPDSLSLPFASNLVQGAQLLLQCALEAGSLKGEMVCVFSTAAEADAVFDSPRLQASAPGSACLVPLCGPSPQHPGWEGEGENSRVCLEDVSEGHLSNDSYLVPWSTHQHK